MSNLQLLGSNDSSTCLLVSVQGTVPNATKDKCVGLSWTARDRLSSSEDVSKHPAFHFESQEVYRGGLGSRGVDGALCQSLVAKRRIDIVPLDSNDVRCGATQFDCKSPRLKLTGVNDRLLADFLLAPEQTLGIALFVIPSEKQSSL